MYNKNDKIAEELINFSDKDVKLLSDEDIAAQYNNFECTSISVEPSRVHDNWYNFTLELEFPDADHPDFSDYVIENVYYDADADRWGFDNWYPEETSKQLKELMLKELEKEGYLKPDDEDYDLEAIGLVNGTTDIVVVKNNKTGLYQLNKFDKNESDRIGHMIATKTFETEAEAEEWYLSWSKSRGNNDIAESLINEDDTTSQVDIKALDTNKFGEVENLEFELVHDGETYYVECYAPDLANEDYYVIRVYKTEGQQLNNETEVAKGYTDSTGGVFAGDELDFYDYENDYSELTQKIMDVILSNLKEVVSHEQLESKMNEISDKLIGKTLSKRFGQARKANKDFYAKYPKNPIAIDKDDPRADEWLADSARADELTKKARKSYKQVMDRNAIRKLVAKGREMENDNIAESLLNEVSDEVVSDVTGRRASDYIWTKMHPDENSPEDTEKMRKKLARNLDLVNKRNARKDKENNMQNDDIAESLLNEVSDELKQRVIDKRKENVKNAQDKLNRATRLAKQVQPITITITPPWIDMYEDSYEEGEKDRVANWKGTTVTGTVNSFEDIRDLYAEACTLSDNATDFYFDVHPLIDDVWMRGNIFVTDAMTIPSEAERDSWKKGELKLYQVYTDAHIKFENSGDSEIFINIMKSANKDRVTFEESKESDSSLNKITEEDLNDLLSMSGERYTNIADLDMPAPLADSVPTTEDGEPITIELLYKAITDLTATIGNLATSIKQPKVELKPLENPMGQPAPKAEPALTDDLIGELDDVADDEQKAADDEKDIKDKESEIEDDAEDLDELDKEIEADLDNTEKADKKKKDKKSDKDEDDKKKKNEDLETAKKEIDKAIADKKSPEEIDATIDYTTDNDTDEKAANEYKVQKMKEACKASVKNSLLNKLKWGN